VLPRQCVGVGLRLTGLCGGCAPSRRAQPYCRPLEASGSVGRPRCVRAAGAAAAPSDGGAAAAPRRRKNRSPPIIER